jgi:hypothetical protein
VCILTDFTKRSGKGPNVAVVGSDKKEQLFFGVADPTTASAVLDVAAGVEFPIQLLVAATSIVEAEQSKRMKQCFLNK